VTHPMGMKTYRSVATGAASLASSVQVAVRVPEEAVLLAWVVVMAGQAAEVHQVALAPVAAVLLLVVVSVVATPSQAVEAREAAAAAAVATAMVFMRPVSLMTLTAQELRVARVVLAPMSGLGPWHHVPTGWTPCNVRIGCARGIAIRSIPTNSKWLAVTGARNHATCAVLVAALHWVVVQVALLCLQVVVAVLPTALAPQEAEVGMVIRILLVAVAVFHLARTGLALGSVQSGHSRDIAIRSMPMTTMLWEAIGARNRAICALLVAAVRLQVVPAAPAGRAAAVCMVAMQEALVPVARALQGVGRVTVMQAAEVGQAAAACSAWTGWTLGSAQIGRVRDIVIRSMPMTSMLWEAIGARNHATCALLVAAARRLMVPAVPAGLLPAIAAQKAEVGTAVQALASGVAVFHLARTGLALGSV